MHKPDKDKQSEAFVIIEPDGLRKGDGHYEIWHRSLEKAASDQGLSAFILHNKKSDLYKDNSSIPVFDRHSWSVQFSKNKDIKDALSESSSYSVFFNNLRETFTRSSNFSDYKVINLYMYYGSILHLKALLDFKEYYEACCSCIVHINLTLSYEAIRFDPERNKFWGNKSGLFKSILLEAQYFFPYVKVFAMTDRFAKYIFKNFDVLLPTLIHPILTDSVVPSFGYKIDKSEKIQKATILLLGRYSLGKFPASHFLFATHALRSWPC